MNATIILACVHKRARLIVWASSFQDIEKETVQLDSYGVISLHISLLFCNIATTVKAVIILSCYQDVGCGLDRSLQLHRSF